MPRGLFISGTDTDVGKTHIACLIASALKTRFSRVGVMKPAESGCLGENGLLMPRDALRLKEAAGCPLPLDVICPYRLPLPLAPAEAAQRAGTTIDIAHIERCCRAICESSDAVLIEGAGGLLVPLSGRYLFADLVKYLGFPLLIVARAGLGTVNHSLLTIEAARSRGIEILGVVMNESTAPPENDPSRAGNVKLLERLSAVPVWGPVPFQQEGTWSHENGLIRPVLDPILEVAFA
ncbi:MAG: dethiobiotin synthase [Syntrophobacteraceae bacterium]